MEMRVNRFLILNILFALFGCEEQIGYDPSTRGSNQIVVEAILTNEKKNHVIRLSHPYQEINDAPIPVTGAIVAILEGNDRVVNVTESEFTPGEYHTEEMTAVFGRVYTLLVRYQGRDYVAQSRSIPVEPLATLSYEKAGGDSYRLIVNDSGVDPNFVEHLVDWTTTTTCGSSNLCQGRLIYYDLKTIDVQEIFKPGKTDFVFPEGTIVIRKKYSVSPDYKEYLRSILSETEWRGGIFDVQRANAKGNVSGGAIGFFAVSSVLSDTTLIVKKP